MQDYFHFAEKNGIVLREIGNCQFCGAHVERGVHECLEVFNLGFHQIDYGRKENHLYRFLTVDAHTLQHPEIHGRWNNHFHLTRLHLILKYEVKWTYSYSPKLSDTLKQYKVQNPDERLDPPPIPERGIFTVVDAKNASSEIECKRVILQWAQEVYRTWEKWHNPVDKIALSLLNSNTEISFLSNE